MMKNLMIFFIITIITCIIMSYVLPSHNRPYNFVLDPINDRINYVTHKVTGTDDIDLPSSIYKQPI
jgi:hypothetical protein